MNISATDTTPVIEPNDLHYSELAITVAVGVGVAGILIGAMEFYKRKIAKTKSPLSTGK